jgi:HEAT repeat protein
MPIRTTCTKCGAGYNLPDAQRGKTVRCRECSESFVVEDEDRANQEAEERVQPSTRKEAAAGRKSRDEEEDEDRPRKRPRDEEDEDEDERPSRKAAKGSMVPMILIGVGAALLLLCGGVAGLGYYAYTRITAKAEQTIESAFTPPPQQPWEQPKEQPKEQPGEQPREQPKEQPGEQPRELTQPRNLDEALAWLRDSNTNKRRAALDWLRTAPVEEPRRGEVAKAIDPTLGDAELRSSALQTLPRWVTQDNVPSLVKLLDERDAGIWRPVMEMLGRLQDERAAGPLARVLADNDFFRRTQAEQALRALGRTAGEKEVLKYLFDKNANARAGSDRVLRDYRTPDGAIVDAAVKALDGDVETRKLAADDLSKRNRIAEKQPAVATALEGLVKGTDVPARQAGLRALVKWGGPDNAPSVVGVLPDPQSHDLAITTLGSLGGAVACNALAPLLANAGDRFKARNALKQIGKTAETSVKAVLVDPRADRPTIMECISLLGDIGTRDGSLPLLTAIRNANQPRTVPRPKGKGTIRVGGNPELVNATTRAINMINTRP